MTKKNERGMGHCKLVVGEDGARRTNTSNRIQRQIDSKVGFWEGSSQKSRDDVSPFVYSWFTLGSLE